MTGDHYQHNCPKQKKKEEDSRSMTPYPRRVRTSSRESSSASQGNEMFRMFHGHFGTGPWKVLVEEAAPESTAAAAEGSATCIPVASDQQTDDTTPTADPEEENSGEKDLENDEREKLEEEELVLDETVEKMMNMEIKQREDDGDMEKFERGSKYCMKCNIWKTEREWRLQKMHKAKSTLAPADNENNTGPETEDMEQDNEANKDKNPSNDKGGHVNREDITKATCGPDSVGVEPEAIISHPTTRGEAEGEQKTACDWTPVTKLLVGATAQSGARHRSRRSQWCMSTPVWPIKLASIIPAVIWLEPRMSQLTAQDQTAVFLYHWGICVFSLLLRDLTEAQQQVQQLEQCLEKEKKRKDIWKSR